LYNFDRAGLGLVYLDGQLVHSSSIAGVGNLDGDYEILIGQSNNGAYDVAATLEIDDLGIWRRTLTEYDAEAIYLVGAHYGRSFDTEAPPEVQVRIQKIATGVRIQWPTGRLESTDALDGSWNTVPGASAPSYEAGATGTAKFYRVKL
jgi:hypothetical protein